MWQVPIWLISAVSTFYSLLQPPQLSQGSRSLPEWGHSRGCIPSHRGTQALPGGGSALCPVSGCQSSLSLCSAGCHWVFWYLSCTTCLQWLCHTRRRWWKAVYIISCVKGGVCTLCVHVCEGMALYVYCYYDKRLPQLSETIHFSYTPQLLMRIHCKEYPSDRCACAGKTSNS